MPGCGFCNNTDVTQEHLWADWLRELILESRSEGGIRTFRAEIEREGELISFAKNDLELTVGMPCRSCNNGWMSDLENSVRPFMREMVYRGQRTLLDDERTRALIHWVVKTAMVYEFTGRAEEPKYFTQDERRAFKDARALPQNLWIWLGRYDGILPLHSLQLRGSGDSGTPEIFSLTVTANFLVCQVLAYRDSDDDLALYARATQTERLLPLYPPTGAWMNWPPAVTIEDYGLRVLDNRFQNVIRGPRRH